MPVGDQPLAGRRTPATRWQTYVQRTEAEAAFRTLKSDVKVRPIWHWREKHFFA